MTAISFTTLLALVGAGGAMTMLFSLILLRVTLTRRLKKELEATGDYWDSGTIDFGFTNTALFAWVCAIPPIQKFERFQIIYPDLDVRSFANGFEKAVAYAMVGGLMIFFLSAPLFYLFKA